jgi:hypothetical protein
MPYFYQLQFIYNLFEYGFHPQTPLRWLLWEVEAFSVNTEVDIRKLRLWWRVRGDKTGAESSFGLVHKAVKGTSYFNKLFTDVLSRWGLLQWANSPLPSKETWNKLIKKIAVDRETKAFVAWASTDKKAVSSKYLLMKPTFKVDENVMSIQDTKLRASLLQFRANAAGKEGDLTWQKRRWFDKFCPLCDRSAVNTLEHALLHCPTLAGKRGPLLQEIVENLPPEVSGVLDMKKILATGLTTLNERDTARLLAVSKLTAMVLATSPPPSKEFREVLESLDTL